MNKMTVALNSYSLSLSWVNTEQEDSDDLLTVNVSEAAATKLELITLITAKFIHISEENLEVVGTP